MRQCIPSSSKAIQSQHNTQRAFVLFRRKFLLPECLIWAVLVTPVPVETVLIMGVERLPVSNSIANKIPIATSLIVDILWSRKNPLRFFCSLCMRSEFLDKKLPAPYKRCQFDFEFISKLSNFLQAFWICITFENSSLVFMAFCVSCLWVVIPYF